MATGEEVPYSISERDVQYPRITLNPDGTLAVIVPPNTPSHTLVSDQLEWICSEYKTQKQKRTSISETYGPLEDGITLWGQSYQLYERSGDYDIQLGSSRLTVTTPSRKSSISYLRKSLSDALRTAIETIAIDFCQQLDCKYKTLAIRNQRTKWASCSGGDTLNFNLRCTFLPLSHLRYLIAHEVAHLVEPRHNSNLWRLVRMLDGEYESRKSELQGFWYTLHHNHQWKRLLNEPIE